MEEESLLDDIKDYSLKDLEQLENMTRQVIDHWKSMISPQIKEGTKKAIEISMEIAENDLRIILEQKQIKIAEGNSKNIKSANSDDE